jgi:hypothetical protein
MSGLRIEISKFERTTSCNNMLFRYINKFSQDLFYGTNYLVQGAIRKVYRQ